MNEKSIDKNKQKIPIKYIINKSIIFLIVASLIVLLYLIIIWTLYPVYKQKIKNIDNSSTNIEDNFQNEALNLKINEIEKRLQVLENKDN